MFRFTIRDVLWVMVAVAMWVARRIDQRRLQFEIAKDNANLTALKAEMLFLNGVTKPHKSLATTPSTLSCQ
jgi:hypothetical protein